MIVSCVLHLFPINRTVGTRVERLTDDRVAVAFSRRFFIEQRAYYLSVFGHFLQSLIAL